MNGLHHAGINVRSISDGIDPATSSGWLMLNRLATLAEYERELITERVNAGIAVARESGTRFGRPVSDSAVTVEARNRRPGASLRKDSRASSPTYRLEQSDALPPTTTCHEIHDINPAGAANHELQDTTTRFGGFHVRP